MNIPQEELADVCKVARQTIAAIENGKVNSDFALMTKIFQYLRSKGAPEFNLYKMKINLCDDVDCGDREEKEVREEGPEPCINE